MTILARALDRRNILGMLAATPAVMASMSAWAQDGTDAYLLEIVPGDAGLRAPDATGALGATESIALLKFFQHIGKRWEMDKAGVGDNEFDDLVGLKTSEKPSYLTEYREAAALLARATKSDSKAAWDAVLLPRKNVPNFDATRLGRFQKYTANEFITLYVVRGGFKRYGYTNYKGFQGGPFTDPAHTPYRTLKG